MNHAVAHTPGLRRAIGIYPTCQITPIEELDKASSALGSGRATAPYVARQGTALGRAGRVHISADPDGTIWVGGGSIACITGTVDL